MVHTPSEIQGKRVRACFYRTEAGNEPVKDWLDGKELDGEDRKKIWSAIAVAEYGWPVGMPTCRHLDGDIQEVRVSLKNNRIVRVLFMVSERRMMLLHGFVKKSSEGRETPKHEIDVAKKRLQTLNERLRVASRGRR
jgi:phage-related protein